MMKKFYILCMCVATITLIGWNYRGNIGGGYSVPSSMSWASASSWKNSCIATGTGRVPLELNITDKDLSALSGSESIRFGGTFTPDDCTPAQHVAIILPMRNREEHLRIYLNRMHPILQTHGIKYTIFVAEQIHDNALFNKGKLLNVAVDTILKMGNWDCLILNDIDVLPEDSRVIYSCKDKPQHIGWRLNKFNYRLPYSGFLGGVTAMTPASYVKVNGFPNHYWGWGGEDDEFARRVLSTTGLDRPKSRYNQFTMIKHDRDEKKWAEGHSCRSFLCAHYKHRQFTDGLNSLRRHVSIEEKRLYTHIMADLQYDEVEKRTVNELCKGH